MKTGIKYSIVVAGFLSLLAAGTTTGFAAYFNTDAISACPVQIINTLQVGSEGDQVFTLQNLLSRGGYMYVAPNGYFGPATRAAVVRFQADNGISRTGTVGPMTRNAVNERLCDNDVRGDALSYSYGYGYNAYNGYASGVTYVDQNDPFVRVVTPAPSTPTVFGNPATTEKPGLFTPAAVPLSSVSIPTPTVSYTSAYGTSNYGANYITPATTNNQIAGTSIIYNPSAGYTYGIVPQSGSLTISTPTANSIYNEGDTVTLAWSTSNLNVSQFQVLLESTITGQSKVVNVTSGHSASFVLSKELLDSICSGTCNNSQQGSFRIVIATPVTDIAGITTTLRAAVAPVTITRPPTFAQVSISTSKTPVNSNEVFKLYVNIPGATINTYAYGSYTFKIHAVCPSAVMVSIAGVQCGQDFTMPTTSMYTQQEVPAVITNASWFRQDIAFELTAYNAQGQIIGTSQTVVTVNPAPFSF